MNSRRLARERLYQGVEQAHRLFAGHAAEALRRAAVHPQALLARVLECRGQAVLQLFVKPGAVDDMAELVDEDALDLHPALVLEDVLLGKYDHRPLESRGEESALAPVVKVELLALLVGAELRQVGGELVVTDQDAEDFAIADALGDLRLDARHHLVELVGGLEVGEI